MDYKLLFENMPPSILLDKEGRVFDINNAASILLVVPKDRAKGRVFSDLCFDWLGNDQLKSLPFNLDRETAGVRNGEHFSGLEFEVKKINAAKNNIEKIFKINISPIKNCTEFLVIFEDVTGHRFLEKENKILKAKNLEKENSIARKKNALTEILGVLEIEKKKIANRVDVNVQKLLLPVIEKLIEKSSSIDRRYLMMIKQNLEVLTSNLGTKLVNVEYNLTPKELELCTLIKGGFSVKEVAVMLNLSERTIETHRFNIRKKLGISSSKVNLASYLSNL